MRACPLERIQGHIERLYGLDRQAVVTDFLLTAEAAAELHGGTLREEQVLVRDDGDEGVSLGVYVDPSVVDRLGAGGAASHLLRPGGLQDYCHAAEGVSHFVLLVWSACQERSVRALDLELQAEVDKGLTCLLTGRIYADPEGAAALLRRLYEDNQLLAGLSPDEEDRYALANDLAYRYLRALLPRMRRDLKAALGEVREFYRLPGRAKRLAAERLAA